MKSNLVDKTISLYENSGWKKWFSKIRFWDAPYVQIEKLVPKNGKILDLGCGEGIFTNFLALSSQKRSLVGYELDKDRLKHANKKLKNVRFKQANLLKIDLPKSNAIVIFHVLHHLTSLEGQEEVLKKCLKSITKKGKIIIVEVEPKFSIKYLITWLTDHFLVPVLFEKRAYSKIFFRSKKEWLKLFKKLNLKTKSFSMDKNMPFSHIAYVLTR